jgi:hypothetical protein
MSIRYQRSMARTVGTMMIGTTTFRRRTSPTRAWMCARSSSAFQLWAVGNLDLVVGRAASGP